METFTALIVTSQDELGTDRQSVRHFFIAKGSSAELQTLLIIGNEVGYIDTKLAKDLLNECSVISPDL